MKGRTGRFVKFRSGRRTKFLVGNCPVVSGYGGTVATVHSKSTLKGCTSSPSFTTTHLSRILFGHTCICCLLGAIFNSICFSARDDASLPSGCRCAHAPTSIVFGRLVNSLHCTIRRLPRRCDRTRCKHTAGCTTTRLLTGVCLGHCRNGRCNAPRCNHETSKAVSGDGRGSCLNVLCGNRKTTSLSSYVCCTGVIVGTRPLMSSCRRLFHRSLNSFSGRGAARGILGTMFSRDNSGCHCNMHTLAFFINSCTNSGCNVPDHL